MKKFWHQNRIFMILMGIVLICVIIMLVFLMKLFFNGGKDKYGDRLNNIKKVQVTEKMQKSVIDATNADEKVTKTEITINGGTIYVTINLENVGSVQEAEGKAVNAINAFSEKILNTYDIQFTLLQNKTEKDPQIKIMGCKNANGTGLVWNNDTDYLESEE